MASPTGARTRWCGSARAPERSAPSSQAARDRFTRCLWASRSGTRTPSRDSWTGSCAEAPAAELARLDGTHEERVELVVLLAASRPEQGHGLGVEPPVHLEPAPEDTHPLLGEVL